MGTESKQIELKLTEPEEIKPRLMEPKLVEPKLIEKQIRPFDFNMFGYFPINDEIINFRVTMSQVLVDQISRRFDDHEKDIVKNKIEKYTGGKGDFFILFYPFTWSFLYFFKDSKKCFEKIIELHAISLFMHLWDDHLTDGRIEGNSLNDRIFLAANERYNTLIVYLTDIHEINEKWFGDAYSTYSKATSKKVEHEHLNDFLEYFKTEIEIWKPAPFLLDRSGRMLGAICHFCVCWRIADDLSDLHEDVHTSTKSSVWYALDAEGKALWSQAKSADGFKNLVNYIQMHCINDKLIERALDELYQAEQLCIQSNWNGLAEQLSTIRMKLKDWPNEIQ